MSARTSLRRRITLATVSAASIALIATACTSNTPNTESTGDGDGGGSANQAVSDNDAPGDEVVIGFSAPAADHGWMGAISAAAKAEAEKYEDVDLRVAEGTNDVNVQISQIEGFINDGVDAIVLLPFDGAALPAPTGASVPAPETGRGNPYDTVEDLFRAIAASDEGWIKKLYRWEIFFADSAPEKLDERVSDYARRLIAKVGPTLKGRERVPVDIKLTPEVSEMKVALRDVTSRAIVATYEFKLVRGADGWKITSIRP